MKTKLVLQASTDALVSQLTYYAKTLSKKLEKIQQVSIEDYRSTHSLALNLIRQMNNLKAEAKSSGRDISSESHQSFLQSVKSIRTRLAYLKPERKIEASKALYGRKIEHHKSQIKKIKKQRMKYLLPFSSSEKRLSLKKTLVREIKRHETEMEKSMTRLAALSKEFSIRY